MRLKVADPETLSLQLVLLVDGAIAAALVRGDPAVARAAREAARVLLAATGVDPPKSAESVGASRKRRLRDFRRGSGRSGKIARFHES